MIDFINQFGNRLVLPVVFSILDKRGVHRVSVIDHHADVVQALSSAHQQGVIHQFAAFDFRVRVSVHEQINAVDMFQHIRGTIGRTFLVHTQMAQCDHQLAALIPQFVHLLLGTVVQL